MTPRACLPLLIGLLLAAPLHRASAQPAVADAAARAAFDEGVRLVAEGKVAEACPRFEESLRIKQGVGTLINLGDCYEKTGRLVLAWQKYTDASSLAGARGNAEQERDAKKRADALNPRIAFVTIRVAEEPLELQVIWNGVTLGKALWGLTMPADPGKYTLEAVAPGHERWTSTVELAPGASTPLLVPALKKKATGPTESRNLRVALLIAADVPGLEVRWDGDPVPREQWGTPRETPAGKHSLQARAPGKKPWSSSVNVTADGPPSITVPPLIDEPPPAPPPRSGTWKTVGYVATGLGAVTAVSSLVLQLSARSSASDAIDRRDRAGYDDARDQQTLATVGMIAGGVLAAGGLALIFLAPPEKPTTALRLAPAIGPGLAGLRLGGGW